MDITLQIAGEKKVIRLLNETGDRARDLARPLADFGERLVKRIGQRISRKFTERSGRLKGSLNQKASKGELVVSAGGTAPGGGDAVRYARIQHMGGIIRPKKAKALTIPFPGGPADKRVPLRASDFTDTFIKKGIIFKKEKKRIVPLFILKKQVEIPARPYMYAEQKDVDYLRKSVSDYITGGWGK